MTKLSFPIFAAFAVFLVSCASESSEPKSDPDVGESSFEVSVSGLVTELQDSIPVDGPIVFVVEDEDGIQTRFQLPSLFGGDGDLKELHDEFAGTTIGDNVLAEGTRGDEMVRLEAFENHSRGSDIEN